VGLLLQALQPQLLLSSSSEGVGHSPQGNLSRFSL